MPVPLEAILPPDLTAFFSSISDTDGENSTHSPLKSAEVISVTESESEDEVPLLAARLQACQYSPEIVPETQMVPQTIMGCDDDFMVRSSSTLIFTLFL